MSGFTSQAEYSRLRFFVKKSTLDKIIINDPNHISNGYLKPEVENICEEYFQQILEDKDLDDLISNMRADVLSSTFEAHIPEYEIETNWKVDELTNILESEFNLQFNLKAELEKPSNPIMEHVIPVRMGEEIEITSKETILDTQMKPNLNNWPRPKALNRSFELAVNSLDIKGKKDLISCAIMQTSEDVVNELGWETHQIDAVISFSNQKLPEFNFSTHRLASKHTLQGCQNLLSLVLGRT